MACQQMECDKKLHNTNDFSVLLTFTAHAILKMRVAKLEITIGTICHYGGTRKQAHVADVE